MADGDESERIDGESRVNELKLELVERVSNGQVIINSSTFIQFKSFVYIDDVHKRAPQHSQHKRIWLEYVVLPHSTIGYFVFGHLYKYKKMFTLKRK